MILQLDLGEAGDVLGDLADDLEAGGVDVAGAVHGEVRIGGVAVDNHVTGTVHIHFELLHVDVGEVHVRGAVGLDGKVVAADSVEGEIAGAIDLDLEVIVALDAGRDVEVCGAVDLKALQRGGFEGDIEFRGADRALVLQFEDEGRAFHPVIDIVEDILLGAEGHLIGVGLGKGGIGLAVDDDPVEVLEVEGLGDDGALALDGVLSAAGPVGVHVEAGGAQEHRRCHIKDLFHGMLFVEDRGIEAEKCHALLDGGDFLLDEVLALGGQHGVPGVVGDEIPDPALVVDDAVGGELLVGAHHRVRVHPDVGTVLSHGRDAVSPLELSGEDAVGDHIHDLEIDGFFGIEVHSVLVLNGFDAAPDTPAEADGQEATDNDSGVHAAGDPMGKLHIIHVVEVDVRENPRNEDAGQERQHEREAEQDGDRAHELVLLEADAAKQEVQEVAEDADDGRENEAGRREGDRGLSTELRKPFEQFAVSAREPGEQGLSVGGIHQGEETIDDHINHEEQKRDDDAHHQQHRHELFRLGSRDHQPVRSGLLFGQIPIGTDHVEFEDGESEEEHTHPGIDDRGGPVLREHQAREHPDDIEDGAGAADHDGGLGVVPPHLLEVVFEIGPEALEVEDFVHGLVIFRS